MSISDLRIPAQRLSPLRLDDELEPLSLSIPGGRGLGRLEPLEVATIQPISPPRIRRFDPLADLAQELCP